MNNPTISKPDKRQTMGRMLAAAHAEFSSKGLAGARISEITRNAGVTKQLIFHYYGSKEGLFVATLDETSEKLMSEWVRFDVERLAPPEALRALLNHFFDQYRNDPLLARLAQEGIRYHGYHQTPRNRFLELTPALIEKVSRIIQRGVESGDFRSDIEPRMLLATAALVTTGWFTNGYSTSALAGLDTSSEEDMATWRKHCSDFILASVVAAPWQQLAEAPRHLPAHA